MCRSVACIEISHSNIEIDIKEAVTEKLTHIEDNYTSKDNSNSIVARWKQAELQTQCLQENIHTCNENKRSLYI